MDAIEATMELCARLSELAPEEAPDTSVVELCLVAAEAVRL